MSKVFVVDKDRRALAPCTPRRARLLLSECKAAVLRRYPFTIILKQAYSTASPRPLRLKLYPSSRTTGLAVINESTAEVVWAAELRHRGQLIKNALEARRSLRSGRRSRKTRYRPARWLNRKRKNLLVFTDKEGVIQCGKWLPPSLQHRIEVVLTWVERLERYLPITAISQELMRFDTQKLQNPEISGVEYQQGTLHGYEVREYLLEKWSRQCAYCGAKDTRLEINHIISRSHGGSDRVSNLTLSCKLCREKKKDQPVEEFLAEKPAVLRKLQRQAKAPLRDVAAINSTRYRLLERLRTAGLIVEISSGGQTRFNRVRQQLPKTHWLDAVCVGASTPKMLKWEEVQPLAIKAMGHGKRQMVNVDAYGFPRGRPKGIPVHPFRTGDIVRAEIPKGKYAGNYTERISSIKTAETRVGIPNKKGRGTIYLQTKYITAKVFSADGYDYGFINSAKH
jgi:5-methylcytosine-specific restriction endonuclease McrA